MAGISKEVQIPVTRTVGPQPNAPDQGDLLPPPHPILLSVAFLLLVVGCDPTVDTFEENDRHYSLFGFLNATADTQFVRVEPLRDSMLTRAPATLDATVQLTNLATQDSHPLRDSLFQYLDRATAHNFYTTEDIELGTTYRLTVRTPSGEASRALIDIPDAVPNPSVHIPVFRDAISELNCDDPHRTSPNAVLSFRGDIRIVGVKVLYDVGPIRTFGHLADTLHIGTDVVQARIPYVDDLCQMSDPQVPEQIKVIVAAGSSQWPKFLALDDSVPLIPGTTSNVDGGVGFVGGIATDTVTMYSEN